jgi:hypothetical protein
MAIEFARMQIVSRSAGGNACCKASYNARIKLKDERTNVTYNFTSRGDNVYHTVLLPEGVDKKFKDRAILMNEVERTEKRKNSQLLKDIVIALPDDKELDLQDRINITHEIIDKMGWVKEGLGVQVNIHKPHDGEKNWHAHLLVTTRRFTPDGMALGEKARDLNPEFRSNKQSRGFIIPEETMLHDHVRDVINRYFEKLGLENRVDLINAIPQEHIGPVRMRSIFNEAVERNELRKLANIKLLKSGEDVLDRITEVTGVFGKKDLERVVIANLYRIIP